ncbi:MAG: hypothetical protein K8T10_04125 [Candidatus Eremiobacteraeota bacterium]|nr:hypothetical protein [Candidatus Eremiobacteraeota bacterium]
MIFLTYQNSFYELLREYLISNSLMQEDLNIALYNGAEVARSQELGFKNLEDYSRYVLLLPFHDRLGELRLLVPNYQPLNLFQYKEQLEAISKSVIDDICGAEQNSSADKMNLITMLTKPIELKKAEKKIPLNILAIDSSLGEEIYSLCFRLKTILPETIEPRITACDPEPKNIIKAKDGLFPPGKAAGLDGNYRSLYLDKSEVDFYRVTDSIRKMVYFRKFDILNSDLAEECLNKFHIITCNNIARFYPPEGVKLIVEKLSPYLTRGGLMLLTLKDKSKYPRLDCLDLIELGKAQVYMRNSNKCPDDKNNGIAEIQESLPNKLIYTRGLFLDKRFDRAKKDIEAVLHNNIDSLKANQFKGDVYVKLKQYENAELQYSKVVFINPNSVAAHFNIAVLSMFAGNSEKSKKHLADIQKKIENFDEKILIQNYNINLENFKILCDELKQKVDADESIDLDKIRERVIDLRERKLEVPDIVVPDLFLKKKKKKKKAERLPLTPGEKKVVNISELPSTRDYGEHDPWKKKQKELEEKQRVSGKLSLPGMKTVAPGKKEPPQKMEEEIEIKVPKTFKLNLGERSSTTSAIEKSARKKKRKKQRKTSKSKSAPKMYFKPVSPETLQEDESAREEKYPEEIEEEEVGEEFDEEVDEEPVGLPVSFRLGLRRPLSDTIIKEVGLPPNFKYSLDALILKEDIGGIKLLIDSYLNMVSPKQREILEAVNKIIEISSKQQKTTIPITIYRGKLKDVYNEIRLMEELLEEKNLLEASILFHKILKMKSEIESLSHHQKQRLKKIRKKLGAKMEKYQQFIDYYFTDPSKIFQRELWNILAQLTPSSNLIEMGKKYGLDIEFLSPELRSKE